MKPTNVKVDQDVDTKTWLKVNGYPDVLDVILRFEAAEKRAGRGTRVSWGLVLAGWPNGNPKTRKGIEFPILAAFQRARGWPVTSGAIQRSPHELAPAIKKQEGRWGKRFRRATH